MVTHAEGRQRDVDGFKQALMGFLEGSGASLAGVAGALGISESTMRAYKRQDAYAPTPFLIHEDREGLSRQRLLEIAIALLTLSDIARRPMRRDIDTLLLKAGYAPLDHDRWQDSDALAALRTVGERVSASRCEAFAGAPGAVAGEWLTEVAMQEERLGSRLMFLDYLSILALPLAAGEQVLASLPADQVHRWKEAIDRRQRAFDQNVTRYPVRHLYRRPALVRWVAWLTDRGSVPVYSTLIDRETASQHFIQLIAFLDRYQRRDGERHGLEIGLSDDPGGFSYEILGDDGEDRILLIDTELGRMPAPHPYRPRVTPLEGLRIEGDNK